MSADVTGPRPAGEGAESTIAPAAAVPWRDIPGPRGLDLYRALPGFSKRPLGTLLDLRTNYGDVVSLPYPLDPVVIVADPEGIEHVLHHAHHRYAKTTQRWRTLRQIWGEGLLTSNGDVWRRQRQRMQPAFHERYLREFGLTMVEEAERIGETWSAAARSGEPRDVYTDMLRCTLRALLRAMFGSDIEARIDLLIAAVQDINGYIDPTAPSNLLNLPIPLRRWVSPGFRPYQRAMNEVRQIFGELIDRRLRSGEQRTDLLGLIMAGRDDERSEAMSQQQVHDEMMVLLMAGHETSGITTTWAWYWLARNPDVARTLHAELDAVLGARPPTPEDVPRLEYTRRTLQEVLRLSPPIYAFDRQAVEDDTICGYRIPKGTSVVIALYVVQRHPQYWVDPLTFDPGRFTEAESQRRPQYAYLPFGGGPRRCVGMRLALMSIPLLIATLASRFRLRLKPGHPVEELARLNLAPKFGLQMHIEERQDAGGAHGSA